MKILIVDDSKAMRMIVTRTLRQAGFGNHTLVEAENGKQGLAAVLQGGVDVVLSDWNMPEMNGIDFVKALRASHPKEKLPVIMVSTEGGQAMMDSAMAQGANGFVCKPFTPESIRGALEAYIG